MANSGRITTGNMPRLLQDGLDLVIKHERDHYKGVGDKIFTKKTVEKGFYEAVQLAGMAYASVKGEGAPIEVGSVDQDWQSSIPVITYSQGARVTMEAIQDNRYEDVLAMMGKEIAQSLARTVDYKQASVFNNSTATTGPDGKTLIATDHPIHSGGTSSNRVSLDFSEDAVEQAVLLVDGFLLPSGVPSDYSTKDLIIPSALRFEAERILKNPSRPSTSDRDINAIYQQGVVGNTHVWKRITDSDSWYITTSCDNGLIHASRKGVDMDSYKEPTTRDVIVSAVERYVTFFLDWRAVVGSPGAG
jgi:hypothetical protein